MLSRSESDFFVAQQFAAGLVDEMHLQTGGACHGFMGARLIGYAINNNGEPIATLH